jgi:hypothetical protein
VLESLSEAGALLIVAPCYIFCLFVNAIKLDQCVLDVSQFLTVFIFLFSVGQCFVVGTQLSVACVYYVDLSLNIII